MGYGCGLRVQEIRDLNKEDIRLSENLILVRKGKNSKRRLVPISEKLAEELQEYLESLEHKTNEFFIENISLANSSTSSSSSGGSTSSSKVDEETTSEFEIETGLKINENMVTISTRM